MSIGRTQLVYRGQRFDLGSKIVLSDKNTTYLEISGENLSLLRKTLLQGHEPKAKFSNEPLRLKIVSRIECEGEEFLLKLNPNVQMTVTDVRKHFGKTFKWQAAVQCENLDAWRKENGFEKRELSITLETNPAVTIEDFIADKTVSEEQALQAIQKADSTVLTSDMLHTVVERGWETAGYLLLERGVVPYQRTALDSRTTDKLSDRLYIAYDESEREKKDSKSFYGRKEYLNTADEERALEYIQNVYVEHLNVGHYDHAAQKGWDKITHYLYMQRVVDYTNLDAGFDDFAEDEHSDTGSEYSIPIEINGATSQEPDRLFRRKKPSMAKTWCPETALESISRPCRLKSPNTTFSQREPCKTSPHGDEDMWSDIEIAGNDSVATYEEAAFKLSESFFETSVGTYMTASSNSPQKPYRTTPQGLGLISANDDAGKNSSSNFYSRAYSVPIPSNSPQKHHRITQKDLDLPADKDPHKNSSSDIDANHPYSDDDDLFKME